MYVTGSLDNAVVAMARDVTQDTLTIVDVEEEGANGVFGLIGPSAVAVSPDSRHVLVTAATDDSLLMFVQEPSNDLRLVDTEINNHGSAGMTGASGVAVSPDGKHVYATGREDDSVALFERDGNMGGVSFIESYTDGVGVVDGLDGASAVAISPDGSYVFVAGQVDNSVAVFLRDESTGKLTFSQALRDGLNGVDGLAGAIALSVSPDALHIYVAGQDDDAVAGFRLAQIIFFSSFESGGTGEWTSVHPLAPLEQQSVFELDR